MASPKRGARPKSRPWRPLALVLVAAVAIVATMFGTGNKSPRLGIDLAGGTSITLSARSSQAGALNDANMKTAKEIINERVNAFGVSEAEVQQEGSRNLVINIPKGKDAESAAKQVGKTALLYFRPVIAYAPTSSGAKGKTPQPTPSPSSGKGSANGKGDAATPSPTASSSSGKSGNSGKALSSALTDGDGAQGSGGGKDAKAGKDDGKDGKGDSAGGKDGDKSGKGGSTPPGAPPQMPGDGQAIGTVPPSLKHKFDALKCDKKGAAAQAGTGKPGDQVVACGKDGYKYALGPVAVSGTQVKSATAALPQGTQVGGWEVDLNFTGKGANTFSDVTGKLAKQQSPQNQFAIVLDGQVMSAPSVSKPITGGSASISGSFTQKSAGDLANVLKYGALPLTFDQSDITQVSAALGGDQLEGGLIAGAIGIGLILVYTLAYYRGLGLVSIASLCASMILTYGIMTLLGPAMGFALNLPAVCGAIVAVGITADSFIVYFERIRDELREGRTLRPSVEKAWPKARRTILVSDFVTFLAAAVLFIVAVGKVQGFAFTLGLTTLLDVVVVFLFTKPLMTLLARRKFFADGHKWSGLDPRNLGARRPGGIKGRLAGQRRTDGSDATDVKGA